MRVRFQDREENLPENTKAFGQPYDSERFGIKPTRPIGMAAFLEEFGTGDWVTVCIQDGPPNSEVWEYGQVIEPGKTNSWSGTKPSQAQGIDPHFFSGDY